MYFSAIPFNTAPTVYSMSVYFDLLGDVINPDTAYFKFEIVNDPPIFVSSLPIGETIYIGITQIVNIPNVYDPERPS